MVNLLNKIKRLVVEKELIKPEEKVLVGVSGGIDSVTLFHILYAMGKEMGFTTGIAHVNHLLRGEESERDERFVAELAWHHHVPFHIERFDVRTYARQRGLSIQHAAREIRYTFFNNLAKNHHYNRIAIAHNLDDQVETFILRLIKGTGIKGLSSIPVERGLIIRPLLYTYRSEIEDYARQHKIRYVEDSSNRKTYYERNFIRKNIIPLMETLNPSFKEKVFLLLNDITRINSIFEKKSNDFIEEHTYSDKEDINSDREGLTGLDPETRFRVLREIVSKLEPVFILQREHTRQIENILFSKRPNVSAHLPYSIMVKRKYNKIVFTKKPQEGKIEYITDLKEGINFLEPLGIIIEVEKYSKKDLMPFINPVEGRFNENIAFFDYDKMGRLSVRTFKNGDRFIPLGMKDRIKVKDFFISKKIPLEERKKIPFLLSDNEIAWIIGYRIDNRFRVTEKTEHILKVQALPIHKET
ncbi:MAG: tRNA lysidine(34) synthetase TilS [Syntrophorhabdaceae bacterium]|nr:tRNA lysidine(34) synthetase TilS [Syntrophorhabdaceae bacterium]